jgi:hypothetical protein
MKGDIMKTQVAIHEVLDFVEYVDSFYNPVKGVYPIGGLTTELLTDSIKKYLKTLNDSTITWGGGDSVDRERVRDIILQNLGRA